MMHNSLAGKSADIALRGKRERASIHLSNVCLDGKAQVWFCGRAAKYLVCQANFPAATFIIIHAPPSRRFMASLCAVCNNDGVVHVRVARSVKNLTCVRNVDGISLKLCDISKISILSKNGMIKYRYRDINSCLTDSSIFYPSVRPTVLTQGIVRNVISKTFFLNVLQNLQFLL
jgi:hypothetical protein